MDLRGYIRQARRLPLGVALRKAAQLAARTGRARMQLASDIVHGSYGAGEPALNPAARIAIAPADVPADLRDTLRALSAYYLAHRFDLLGSGWVSPVYRCEVAGFLGHRYPPQDPAAPDKSGAGLEHVVNRSNVTRARTIWRLIGRLDYTPIDWQLDFRSGYRWSAQRPSLSLAIPVDRGADVKMPWELARLQHLPQLALCAILAYGGAEGFAPAARYVQEIADQLADFLATNPPRFGVNWLGAMDVAIRAANIALTLALLAGAGLALSPAMNAVVAGALDDHAAHVVAHLDYSESGRSNHYLANLGGLIWANWLLTGENAEQRLVFAIAALLKEADNQFLADGGNYEGSTNYHRLSGEIVLFSLVVTASLSDAALARLERAQPPRPPWRAGFPSLPLPRHGTARGGAELIPPQVLSKLSGAARLARAVQGTDNTIVQIGDTDSGRFFKLHPTLINDGDTATENTLDHRGFVDAVDAFLSHRSGETFDAVLVRRLCGAQRFEGTPPPQPADFGDVEALIARWNGAPEHARRLRRIPFGAAIEPSAWSRAAFADFGLYVFRHGARLVAFRCAGAPPASAPRGHGHDDNLSIEYRLGAQERRDSGSYVYTPGIATRNQYRSAEAHDVPRIRGEALVKSAGLFDVDEVVYAQCVCWRPNAVAGEVSGPAGTILRVLRLTADALEIYDCVSAGQLADIAPPLPVARGYGRL